MREYHTTAMLAALIKASSDMEDDGIITHAVGQEMMDRVETIFTKLLKGEVTEEGLSVTPKEGKTKPCMDAWMQRVNSDLIDLINEVEPTDAKMFGYNE